MARRDPRFNAFDHIRLFEKNLTLNDKRLVIAWFLSMIPIKEPKVDVLQLILDLAAAIPGAGTASVLFDIGIRTAQIVKDLSELFGFEFDELDVELARLKFELETAEEMVRRQRDDLVQTRLELDVQTERANALLGTIELLEDELRKLETRPSGLNEETVMQIREVDRRIRIVLFNAGRLPASREAGEVQLSAAAAQREWLNLRGLLDG